MADAPNIGDRVRFAPNPRWPARKVEAMVIRKRKSPNAGSLRNTCGWLDTNDDAGVERSVRPGMCEVI